VLRRTFSLVPEYLTTAEQDDVVNLMDYGVQLGRRFRALKLWMVIRAFGVEGLADRLRQHVALAQELASWIRTEPSWEVLAPVPFSVVCFRFAPEETSERERNRMNQEIMERVNASGRVFLSHTKLGDTFTIRVAIGNIRTTRTHVEEAWTLLRAAAAQVLQSRVAGARA
jgi:aromatic-L-amino-acid decarboxylase